VSLFDKPSACEMGVENLPAGKGHEEVHQRRARWTRQGIYPWRDRDQADEGSA
jgi:hypothetical protein